MGKIYATKTQIAEYLGVSESTLPSNISTLVERAMEVIDEATLQRIPNQYLDSQGGITNAEVALAIQKATSAQIEYWLNIDPSQDIMGKINSLSIGKFSMNYDAAGMPILAPRAKRLLMPTGLMYRGVGRI